MTFDDFLARAPEVGALVPETQLRAIAPADLAGCLSPFYGDGQRVYTPPGKDAPHA